MVNTKNIKLVNKLIIKLIKFCFVFLQNKLNCEVLYDDLGYELRWVMDGDDIVMQLVGKVGKLI